MFSFKEAAKIVALMNVDERRQFNRLGEKLIEVKGTAGSRRCGDATMSSESTIC